MTSGHMHCARATQDLLPSYQTVGAHFNCTLGLPSGVALTFRNRELWVFATWPALQGSTISHAGVAHVSKNCLEYSNELVESAQKKKLALYENTPYDFWCVRCMGRVKTCSLRPSTTRKPRYTSGPPLPPMKLCRGREYPTRSPPPPNTLNNVVMTMRL